jgi:hypothetical protein
VSAVPNGLSARRESSAADVAAKLAALSDMTVSGVRAEWRRLYRSQPPKGVGRSLLELGVAWKLQERALGGLSAATRRRLAELTKAMDDKGDLTRARTTRLKPGTRLIREWRGEFHDVLVLEDGFRWKGQRWRSLSAIAREISGTNWSGPRFFGLSSKNASTST